MSYYRGVARDEFGNALNDASVSVYAPGTTTASTLYSEETLTTALDNPFETGVDGVYEFYADPGYYDIQVAKSGFSTVTLTDQAVGAVVGHIYMGAGGSAVVNNVTPSKLDATFGTVAWTLAYGGGFTLDGDDHLNYAGNPTIQCLIQCGVEFSDAGGGSTMRLNVMLNDNPASANSKIVVDAATAGEKYLLICTTVLQLVTGDDITIGLTRGTASSTVTVANAWITATGLG
jgi:hypothetical protein